MSGWLTMAHLSEIGMLDDPQQERGLVAADASKPSQASSSKSGKQQKPLKPAPTTVATAETSAGTGAAFEEKSPEQLAKMSKEERKAYHQARIAQQAGPVQQTEGDAPGKQQLTKAHRRAVQEAQRKAKEDSKVKPGEFEELLRDLKLQGLTEDQAREVIKEMANAEVPDEDDDDDDEVEDLMTSVRRWMDEQDVVTADSLSDFMLKVRFQGHADSLPPDHVRSIVHVLISQVLEGVDLANHKLQPGAIAAKMKTLLERWSPLLKTLLAKITDSLQATDSCVQSTFEALESKSEGSDAGRASAAVGCLMAMRDVELIEDDDLLMGCKRVEYRSNVLDKFVEFLERELEDDDEDSDDE